MRKKTTIGLFLIITFGQFTFGQTKVYNGKFNSLNFQGYATYNYIEQPEKRIFSGPFLFTNQNKTLNISGNFQNDLKNGLWKFSLTNVSYKHFYQWNITANVIGSFKNGNLEGNWTLTRTKNTIAINNEKIKVEEKSIANFKNNHFSDKFTYSDEINKKSQVNGQFNDEGYFDGVWTINYFRDGILNVQSRHYINGVLAIIKNKNTSTGEVSTLYDKTFDVEIFFQNYDSIENVSRNGETYYKIVDRKSENKEIQALCENNLFEEAIDIWYNNSYFPTSAYLFEIEKGTNKLDHYPEREIIIENVLTKKLKLEKEQLKFEEEERERAEKEERRKIEQAKIRQEEERIREQLENNRELENSDYGKLKKDIKIEFKAWLEKGEFETQEEFEKRVKNNYENKFQEIVKNKISQSKERSTWKISIQNNCLTSKLGNYDVENQAFKIKIFLNSYEELQASYININIPRSLAQPFKQICKKREDWKSSLLYVKVLDYLMIDNYWIPSSVILIFDNSTYTRGGSYGLDKSEYCLINESNKDKYQLSLGGHKFNIINIQSLNENDTFENAIYYYKWTMDSSKLNQLNFTIEELGITLPF